MARLLLGLLLTPLAVAHGQVVGGAVGEGPEPAPHSISWEFDFRYLDLRRIDIQLGGRTEAYWYMPYTVINTSPDTQRFFPQFEIVTETLHVALADVGIPRAVYDAIRERHRITHKYLAHPTKAIGPLRSGADNAIESVAVWRAEDLNVNEFTLYIAGLSGESRLVPNPAYDPAAPQTKTVAGPTGRQQEITVNPRTFTLRKTLAISYTLPGSPAARGWTEPQPNQVSWIMR
jgi:hypothetical protein